VTAWTKKPTPESVAKFAKRMEDQWTSGQSKLDDLMLALILMAGRDLTIPDGKAAKLNTGQAKARQSGIGYVIWRENAQLLKTEIAWTIPVPDDMKDLRDHVDYKLEPLLAGLWHRQTRDEPWWEQLTDDYPALGRAWAFSSHVPKRWAGEEIKAASKEYNEATGEKETSAAKTKLHKLKQGKLPLRTRYADSRSTWSYFDTDVWLPQVVEIKKLTKLAAIDLFGEDKIPGEYSSSSDETEIKVAYYANHRWCVPVLMGSEAGSAKFAEEPWEHNLGRNPYLLFEADLLPRNDKGWRWAGLLFHAKDNIDLYDQILTDLAYVHHEWTMAPIIQKRDKEELDDDVKVAGAGAPKLTYGPGAQIAIWNTESIERGPVPEIPQQSIFLLLQIKDSIEKMAMVPEAERGELKAGTSNNAYSSQIAVSRRRSKGIMQGMARFAAHWAANQFRGIYELTKGGDETVTVMLVGEKGFLSAGWEDVDGWDEAVVPIVEEFIQVDEYTYWLIGQIKVEAFGYSPEQIMEERGVANPEAVTKRGWMWQMSNATREQDLAAMLALSGQKYAELTSGQQGQMQTLLEGASPQVKAIVAQLAGGEVPSPNGQSEENLLRAQRQQMPQNPVEQI
jgi:hypothetical protein